MFKGDVFLRRNLNHWFRQGLNLEFDRFWVKTLSECIKFLEIVEDDTLVFDKSSIGKLIREPWSDLVFNFLKGADALSKKNILTPETDLNQKH